MLIHVVLFNFKPGVSAEKRNYIIELAQQALPRIPGVKHLLAGKTIKPDSEFEFSISMYFESEEALQAYRLHPDHIHFRDVEFFPYLDKKLGLDYSDTFE